MSQYIISWQRWMCPFSIIASDAKRKQKENDFEKSDFSDMHEYSGPVAQTVHGIIPINEANLPTTIFNLWRADTNFPITRHIEFLINTALGVEAYDQISPYRFRIAIGKLFDENDVKKRLNDTIIKYKEKTTQKVVEATKPTKFLLLHKQFEFFAVVLDGEKKIVLHGKSAGEVQEKLAAHLSKFPTSKVEYVSTGKDGQNATA